MRTTNGCYKRNGESTWQHWSVNEAGLTFNFDLTFPELIEVVMHYIDSGEILSTLKKHYFIRLHSQLPKTYCKIIIGVTH